MFEEAYLYHGTPISSPLIAKNTIPQVLAALSNLDQQLPALTYYEQGEFQYSLNYGQFLAAILQTRQILQQTFQIHPGARIGVLCKNCPEVVVFNLAALSLAAILVPLNPHESLNSLHYIIRHSEINLLVYNRELFDKSGLQSSLKTGIRSQAIEEICSPTAAPTVPVSCQDWPDSASHMEPAVLLYTSGTTQGPRGVILSHYNLLINAEALSRVHRLDINKTHMCVLPLFHTNAFGFSMLASYYAGIHLVLNDAFSLFAFWNTLRQERVNICSIVPEIVRVLCQRPVRKETLPHLRYFVSAAAPLSVEIAKQFYEKTAISIHQGYGLSESTNFATTLPYDISQEEYNAVMHMQAQPSIGTALYGTEVAVVNQAGEKVPAGVTGEIVLQGHSNMSGYWRDPDATQKTLSDGFLRTGDLGFYLLHDKKKYFFISGRIKEIILRCGQNISPLEVERELLYLRELGDFAVVGFQHEQMGEEVGLYINTAVPDLITPGCFDPIAGMPFFKRPKVVIIGSTLIPRTSTGKVRRSLLKNFFSAYYNWKFSNDRVVLISTGETDDRNSGGK